MEGNFPNSIWPIYQERKPPILFGQIPKQLISHLSVSPKWVFPISRKLSPHGLAHIQKPCLSWPHLLEPHHLYPGFKKDDGGRQMRAFYGPGMNTVRIALENLVIQLYSERGKEMDSSYLSKEKTGKLFQWTVLSATVNFSTHALLHTHLLPKREDPKFQTGTSFISRFKNTECCTVQSIEYQFRSLWVDDHALKNVNHSCTPTNLKQVNRAGKDIAIKTFILEKREWDTHQISCQKQN